MTKSTKIDGRTLHAKVDLAKAIQLRSKGLSMPDIAKHFNCSTQAVHQALSKFKSDPIHTKNFRENKADIFEFVQGEVINSLDSECIQKTPFVQRMTSLGILEDKIRLIRGQATENISIKSTVQHYANKLQEIEKALEDIGD